MSTPFAAALRALRAYRDWSLHQLATAAGLDASYLSRLEAGTRHPSRAVVAALGRALAPPPPLARWLYEAAGYTPPVPVGAAAEPLAAAVARLVLHPRGCERCRLWSWHTWCPDRAGLVDALDAALAPPAGQAALQPGAPGAALGPEETTDE